MTRRHLARFVRSDGGAATAEYAVVSVAAAGLGGLLIKLLTSDWFADILRRIFEAIITMFLQVLGLG
jgi:Flp pilus assembly pilin Flp